MGKIKTYKELCDQDGNIKTDPSYKEILKLHDLLQDAGITHELVKLDDGWQVIYPEDGKNRICDAIEFYGSYGSENDQLEVMGRAITSPLANDSIEGCVTADDVFQRIVRIHKEIGGQYGHGKADKVRSRGGAG